MSPETVLFVVDDDAPTRDAVCAAAPSLGVRAVPLAAADDLWSQVHDAPGCVVADLQMRTDRGVALQAELSERGVDLPVVALAHGATTAEIVQSMRAGAVTVLDKPLANGDLLAAVNEALVLDAQRRTRRAELADARSRLASLTPKERDVLRMIVAGRPNKAMANHLGASLRTIENRRREVFTKLGVRSVAELVTLVLKAEEVIQ